MASRSLVGFVVLAWLAVGACMASDPPPSAPISGVVIDVQGATLAQVTQFTLRTNDGELIVFEVEALSLADGGKPAPHLREHLASGAPVTVEYVSEAGRRRAIRYTDASAPASPTASPGATTSGPGATASPSPAPTASAASPPPLAASLTPIADGLGPLVLLTNAGDGSGRLFAVGQVGVVLAGGADGTFAPQPFLDISARLSFGGERGLLGLAFHPDYASNGRLYVNYSNRDGDNVIAEYATVPDGSAADAESERILLTIDQPFPNHNGGMLAFGPDGYLYISSGDGGSAGDPLGSGQALDTLLGKVLRIDVDGSDGAAYGIPADNPFADGAGGARPEIWDYGLRNPWRISFDRQTGDLFIADVGQDQVEEVNAEPAGAGGRNYGWNVMEGGTCFRSSECDQAGLTLPATTYRQEDGGCSVTGGYVYRGQAVPALSGRYLFSDYCSGTLWTIDAEAALAGEILEPQVLLESGLRVTGFGEDEAGEIYLVSADGQIVRIDLAD